MWVSVLSESAAVLTKGSIHTAIAFNTRSMYTFSGLLSLILHELTKRPSLILLLGIRLYFAMYNLVLILLEDNLVHFSVVQYLWLTWNHSKIWGL